METASRDVVSKETLKKTKGQNTTIALNEIEMRLANLDGPSIENSEAFSS